MRTKTVKQCKLEFQSFNLFLAQKTFESKRRHHLQKYTFLQKYNNSPWFTQEDRKIYLCLWHPRKLGKLSVLKRNGMNPTFMDITSHREYFRSYCINHGEILFCKGLPENKYMIVTVKIVCQSQCLEKSQISTRTLRINISTSRDSFWAKTIRNWTNIA